MLVARGGPARLTKHQRCEQCLRRGGIAAAALRDRQDQQRIGVSGRRLEDFVCLLCGERRVAIEQPRGVRKRDLDGSDRFCCATATHVTNLPRSLRLESRPDGNCTHATAVEQCGVVIQSHDAFVGLSQQLARLLRGGASGSCRSPPAPRSCANAVRRRAACTRKSFARGQFAQLRLFQPPGRVRHLVLLLSGDGGWGPGPRCHRAAARPRRHGRCRNRRARVAGGARARGVHLRLPLPLAAGAQDAGLAVVAGCVAARATECCRATLGPEMATRRHLL